MLCTTDEIGKVMQTFLQSPCIATGSGSPRVHVIHRCTVGICHVTDEERPDERGANTLGLMYLVDQFSKRLSG